MDGFGEESWAIGLFYKGSFKNDEWHGQGEARFPDGWVYRGEWQHSMMAGYGETFRLEKFANQVTYLA